MAHATAGWMVLGVYEKKVGQEGQGSEQHSSQASTSAPVSRYWPRLPWRMKYALGDKNKPFPSQVAFGQYFIIATEN